MIGKRRVLAVITARGGSKGLPGKNLLPLAGRPLIEWTVLAARASRYVDHTVLSSDDPRIIAFAADLGCEAPFVRSAVLASDSAQSVEVVIDAIDRVSGYDVVVLLQPTSPLRTAADIDGTLALLEVAPAAVSATEASTHPWLAYRPNSDGTAVPYVELPNDVSQRRQALPTAIELNGAVYAADISWFRLERSFVRPQTRFWVMPVERSVDIDTLQDVEMAEHFIAKGQGSATAGVTG